MYKKILLPLDNSDYSNMGIDIGIKIAQKCGAKLTGSHVYAARLHDVRFRQMESGLPEKYLEEEELKKQRDIHDSLITKGLEVVSDSYLDVFEDKCSEASVSNFEKQSLEGKNYKAIVDEVKKNKYDLVTIGALGLGTVKESNIGSVCERVTRRLNVDTLVIKNTTPMNGGGIVVAVDGSPQSFGGLLTGIELGKYFGKKVSVISAFDPYFHYVAFNSIAGVLSSEAAQIFKFKEQEKLHEEIIDSGLAKIYQAHLEISKKVAEKLKVEVKTKLLDGKAFEKILQYVNEENPWLLIMGKTGIHSDEDMDIGSNTENILRKASCHLLISSRKFMPPIEETAKINMVWTKEAEKRMGKVPSFVRGMAKMAVLNFASDNGHSVVTADVIDRAIECLLPQSARDAMGILTKEAIKKKNEKASKIAASPEQIAGEETIAFEIAGEETIAFDGKKIVWDKNALQGLETVPGGFMRNNAKLRIEKYARTNNINLITQDVVSKNIGEGKKMMGGMADMVGMMSKMTGKKDPELKKTDSEKTIQWTDDARKRLEKIPEGFMRKMTKSRIEQYAEKLNADIITLGIAENGLSKAKMAMTDMMGPKVPDQEENKAPETPKFQIDEKIDYYFCDICGYTIKGYAPDECPICRAQSEKFLLVENKKELVTLSSGKVLDWNMEAQERLAKIPEGFMRDMTKWRIEAFARKKNSLHVTEKLMEEKYQFWGESSKKAEKELVWDDKASDKVEKIPSFVRGMIIKEVENQAKKKGDNTVTLETLSNVRDTWSNTMEFHSEFQKDN